MTSPEALKASAPRGSTEGLSKEQVERKCWKCDHNQDHDLDEGDEVIYDHDGTPRCAISGEQLWNLNGEDDGRPEKPKLAEMESRPLESRTQSAKRKAEGSKE